jgi:hypothetical protein
MYSPTNISQTWCICTTCQMEMYIGAQVRRYTGTQPAPALCCAREGQHARALARSQRRIAGTDPCTPAAPHVEACPAQRVQHVEACPAQGVQHVEACPAQGVQHVGRLPHPGCSTRGHHGGRRVAMCVGACPITGTGGLPYPTTSHPITIRGLPRHTWGPAPHMEACPITLLRHVAHHTRRPARPP